MGQLTEQEIHEIIGKVCIIDATGKMPFTENELMFGGKVLKKKVEAFDIPYKIDIAVYMIMELLVQGNPGAIQVLFLDTVKKIPKDERSHIRIPAILNVFDMRYPTMKDIEPLWDAQKYVTEEGHRVNNVDRQQYWFDELEIPYKV